MRSTVHLLSWVLMLVVFTGDVVLAQPPTGVYGPVSPPQSQARTVGYRYRNGPPGTYFVQSPGQVEFGDIGVEFQAYGFMHWTFDQSSLPAEATVYGVELKFNKVEVPYTHFTDHANFTLYDVKLPIEDPATLKAALTEQNRLFDGTTWTENGIEVYATSDPALVNAVQEALNSPRKYLTIGVKRIPEYGQGGENWGIWDWAPGTHCTATLEVHFYLPEYSVQFRNDLAGANYGTITATDRNGVPRELNSGESLEFYWGERTTVTAFTGEYQYASNNWKYRTWTQGNNNDNENPRTFTILDGRPITAYFDRVYDVTVRNDFEGGTGGQLLYKGNPVNSGYTEEDVFRNEMRTFSAITPQTDIGFTWNFYTWDDGVASVERNVSITGTTTYAAKFKAHMASSSEFVLSNASQRKIIRAWNGYYYACYESGGRIWLTRSTDGGATWDPEKEISTQEAGWTNRSPSVGMEYLGPSSNYRVLIAYEASGYTTAYANRVYVKAINPNVAWPPATVEQKEFFTVVASYPFSAMPVLSQTTSSQTKATLLAWYEPPGPYIKGRIISFGTTAILYQGGVSWLTSMPNDYIYWSRPEWALAFAVENTLYKLNAYRDNQTYQLMAWPPVVVAEYGGGISDVSMAKVQEQDGICWLDNGIGSGPSSSYSVRYRQGWNTPVTVWPDVYGSMSSPCVTWDYATQSLSVFWQGASSVYHAKRLADGTWYSPSAVVSGATPAVSVGMPGNVAAQMEVLLSRQGSSAPFGIQRTRIFYGDEPVEDRSVADATGNDLRTHVSEDSTLLREGRGGFVEFPNGMMHIVLVSATRDEEPIRFTYLSDSLSVTSGTQIDQATTTLPFEGNGILELAVRYRSSGTVPSSAQFALEIRDAQSNQLLQRVRTFRSGDDTVGSLSVPLNYDGRLVKAGLVASNMNTAKRFVVERWILPNKEEQSIHVSPLAKAADVQGVPEKFAIHPNYPNPFNPTTQIRFDLPEAAVVSLVIYDVLGREVTTLAQRQYESGYHSVTWNASDAASGIYFARFTATNQLGQIKLAKVNKLVLTK